MSSPCQLLQTRLPIIIVALALTARTVFIHVCGELCPSNQCAPPKVFGDGMVSFSPNESCYATATTPVNITCSGNLYGISTAESCGTDGSWVDYEPPTCEESKCAAREDKMHLYDVVMYSCDDGRFLDGSTMAVCTGNGEWNPPDTPVCSGNCSVPVVVNGTIIYDTPLYQGTSIEIMCDNGFTLTGTNNVTCYDESWSPDVGQCLANCPSPLIKDSNYAEDKRSTQHGEHIIVNCNDNYTSGLGTNVSEPMSCYNGTWDVQLKCYADCVDIAAPTNGYADGEGSPFYHGHILVFNCTTGYTLVGETYLNCSDGSWSADPPECKANCLVPSINNSNLNDSNDDRMMDHDSNITVTCHEGYTFGYRSNFTGTLTCYDGTFDYNDVECLESCDTPTVNNSNWADSDRPTSTPHDGQIVVNCDDGYTSGHGSDQNETLYCTEGLWNMEVYCYANCPNITAPNGGLMYIDTDPFYHNESVYFNCSANYLFVGQNFLYCSDGQWSDHPPDCKASCESPIIENSNYAVDSREYITHGESVAVNCDDGYSSGAGAEVTEILYCVDGGWNSTVYCYGNCPNVTAPDDGIVYVMLPHYHNDVVNYSCDANFTLVGNETVMCTNGSWDDNFPQCMANCADPGTPVNGSQVNPNYTHGGQVRFTCDPGYDVLGATVITCNDGNWSSPIPICAGQTLVDQIKLNCSYDSFLVQIPVALLGDLSETEVVLEGNLSCMAYTNEDLMYIGSSLEGCGTKLDEQSEHDVYTNRVIDNPKAVVSFGPKVQIPVTCTYDRMGTFEVSYRLQNYTIKKGLHESGKYMYLFAIYTDNNFSKIVSSRPFYVALDTVVHFGISLLVEGSYLRVEAQTCWATPASDATARIRWNLINDSCPSDESSVGLKIYVDTTRSLFSLSSFRFINHDGLVYIHCDVLVCEQNSRDCIQPWQDCSTGNRRRKRSAFYNNQKNVKRLRAGPIRLVDTQNSILSFSGIHDTSGLSSNSQFVYIVIIATLAGVSVVLFTGLAAVTFKLLRSTKRANTT